MSTLTTPRTLNPQRISSGICYACNDITDHMCSKCFYCPKCVHKPWCDGDYVETHVK